MYKKKNPQPTRLDLSGFKNRPKQKAFPGIRKVTAEPVEEAPDVGAGHIFLHKGKKHHAWRVLGVPLGASREDLKKSYAHLLSQNPSKKDLYSKAYNLLIKK